jgi:hypothetical protein
VSPQSDAEAEVAMRRRLRGLSGVRECQWVSRVDRHGGRPHAEPGNGGADDAGQRDGIEVVELRYPELAHTGHEGMTCRGYRLVNSVGHVGI